MGFSRKQTIFAFIVGLFLVGVLTSCWPTAPTTTDPDRPERPLTPEERAQDEERRRRASEDAKRRFSDSPRCERDDRCLKKCREIGYSSSDAREECGELPSAQVDKLEEIYEALKDPNERELEDIDAADFDVFTATDKRPLERLISRVNSSSDARLVLTWILNSEEIADVFKKSDRDERLLKDLLDPLGGSASGNAQYITALKKTLYDNKNFMELAIDSNPVALEWVHSFFEAECEDTDDDTICKFRDWYCEVLSSSDDEYWYKLATDEDADFDNIINEILTDYTPANDKSSSTCSDIRESEREGYDDQTDDDPANPDDNRPCWWQEMVVDNRLIVNDLVINERGSNNQIDDDLCDYAKESNGDGLVIKSDGTNPPD